VILIKKIAFSLFVLFILTSCSLNENSNFWTKNQSIEKEKVINKTKTELFKKEITLNKEFNRDIKIRLDLKSKNINYSKKLNNTGLVNYNGELKKISRFKYSKIENFSTYEPDLVFDKNNIIFFNDKGSILKFDENSKLIWKKNYYTKKEKKKKPFLFFANNSTTLIVADNIGKYYSINIDNGNLLWSKTNSAPFNSEIKIYKNKFFTVDYENVLRCYSIEDGEELWNFATELSLIKSQKKLSVIVANDNVYFSNSIGDITAIDTNTGNLIWQTPTQKLTSVAGYFLLKTSDLISDSKSILFSNNTNRFFSLDLNSGILNWSQNINSTIKPTIIKDLIFTITNDGFLVIIENSSGNIIRMTDVFDVFKNKKRSKIKPEGFLVGHKNIYLTTSNGRLLIIELLTGKTKDILKIDNEKISRPFILNKNLFIVKNNSIINLN